MTPALRRGSRSGVGRVGRPGPMTGGRRRGAADATREPEPDPAPEAVFDRVTGPLGRHLRRVARIAPVLPGARADEGA
jgi:hypothetical protein